MKQNPKMEIYQLRRQLDKSQKMVEILQKAECTATAATRDKLASAVPLVERYGTHAVCDALMLSRATFYNHVFRNKNEKAWFYLRDDELKDKVMAIFDVSEGRFGSEKIATILKGDGLQVSKRKVSDLMHDLGLRSRSVNAKADHRHMSRKERDRIRQRFHAAAPNLVWLTDITRFRVKGNAQYVCVILDLFARYVVACRTSHRESTHLVKMTLRDALEARKPAPGLVLHSDRGTVFRSRAFMKYAKGNGVELSVSRPHTPYDNSPMERFFKTLKVEELYRHVYRSIREFKASLSKFVQFYNEKRPHFSNKNRTPAQTEADFATINRGIETNVQSLDS